MQAVETENEVEYRDQGNQVMEDLVPKVAQVDQNNQTDVAA